MRPSSDERLQTVSRASDVLELIVDQGAATLTDVTRRLAIGQTVAYRILQTWVSLGYLRFDAHNKVYRPGAKLVRIGSAMRAGIASPDLDGRMREASSMLGYGTNVAVLEGAHILYIARHAQQRTVFRIEVGSTVPAHATSPGRVLLAYLPESEIARRFPGDSLPLSAGGTISSVSELLADLRRCRRQGYAIGTRSLENGMGGVSVPLRDRSGSVVAALNVEGPIGTFTRDAIRDTILPALARIAHPPVDLPPMIGGARTRR